MKSIQVVTGASKLVKSGPGRFYGGHVTINNASFAVYVYDGNDATGKLIYQHRNDSVWILQMNSLIPDYLVFNTGLFILVEGAANQGVFYYDEGVGNIIGERLDYLITSAGGIVKDGPGRLKNFALTYGTVNAIAKLYDNTTSSGNVLAELNVTANQKTAYIDFNPDWVDFDNLFLTLGSDAIASVYYR